MTAEVPKDSSQQGAVRTWGVFALFLLLAALVCLGVAPDFANRVVGNLDHPGLRGEFFHQWDFADNVLSGHLTDHYYTRNIAGPEGQDLRPFIGFSLHLFFYVPFLWLKSLAARYNVLLILTLALNGFCAFRLGRYASRSTAGGLICGLIFFLSPYALLKAELGFLQKTILWWIPLFLLSLLRFLQERRRRDAFLAGLSWAGMALTYAPYAWLSLIAGAVLTLGALGFRKDSWRGVFAQGWPIAIVPVLTVVFLAFHLPAAGFRKETLPLAILTAPNGTVDLFHAFRFHPYSHFVPQVEGLTLGLPAIAAILAIAAIVLRLPRAWPFFLMGLLFFILSLGPYLQAGGQIISRLPLPYYFLTLYVPWGERIGFSIRALPFVEIAVAVLSAIVVARLAESRRAAWLAVAIAVLLPVERRLLLPEIFPVPASDTRLSDDLHWLSGWRGALVLNLPYCVRGNEPHAYCYNAARSGTRMMNRYIGLWRDYPIPPFPSPSPFAMAAYLTRLADQGCDLILVHPALLACHNHPLEAHEDVNAENYTVKDTEVLREWCGAPVRAGGPDSFIAYRVPSPAAIRKIARSKAALPEDPCDNPLVIAAARERGIPARPSVAESVRAYEDRLAAEALLQEEVYRRVALTDAQIRAYYDAHKESFSRPLQIRVLHVRVPSADGRDRAVELFKRMQASVDSAFGLCAELTRDDRQGLRWGDIGYFSRGTFEPAVEDRLFALKQPGECVMIEAADGIELFRLMDIRPGMTPTFEDVRDRVREEASAEARRRGVSEYLARLAQSATRPADDMVYLPGGEFWAGSTEEEIDRTANMARRFAGRTVEVQRAWFEDETYRLVRVRPFYMDRTEVTLGEYRKFLSATEHRPLPPWVSAIATNDRMPVVGVSWQDAAAYARWLGKRLPTAEEWEWAARGAARRWFPWGDSEPDGARGNYADSRTTFPWNDPQHDDGHAQLACVGSYPAGATPEGILDLGGNAREWTATARMGIFDSRDKHIWTVGQSARVPEAFRSKPVPMYCVRGGAWNNAADDLHAADERMLPPETKMDSLGFRCVRDCE